MPPNHSFLPISKLETRQSTLPDAGLGLFIKKKIPANHTVLIPFGAIRFSFSSSEESRKWKEQLRKKSNSKSSDRYLLAPFSDECILLNCYDFINDEPTLAAYANMHNDPSSNNATSYTLTKDECASLTVKEKALISQYPLTTDLLAHNNLVVLQVDGPLPANAEIFLDYAFKIKTKPRYKRISKLKLLKPLNPTISLTTCQKLNAARLNTTRAFKKLQKANRMAKVRSYLNK